MPQTDRRSPFWLVIVSVVAGQVGFMMMAGFLPGPQSWPWALVVPAALAGVSVGFLILFVHAEPGIDALEEDPA